MDVIVGVGDWLACAPLARSLEPGSARHRGALAVLASTLHLQRHLESPAPTLLEQLRDILAMLPVQLAHLEPTMAVAQWLSVAAAAEFVGEGRLAQLVLDDVRARLASPDVGVPAVDRQEWIAICWTRRGRLSRIAGHHEDARECYREAIRGIRALPWRDGRPLAELGLSALAASQGNFPAVARHAKAVLRVRPPVAAVHQVAAHQLMALVRKRAGHHLDALLHAWAAFDLVPQGDVRAVELMLSMAEIAVDLADWDAADHGFAAAFRLAGPVRLRVSALVGAVDAQTRRSYAGESRANSAQLKTYLRELARLAATDLAPRDAVRVRLALANGAILVGGPADQVTTQLDEAAALATRFQLYEHQFRVDESRARLRAMTTNDHRERPTRVAAGIAGASKAVSRHPALSRLLALSSR